MRFLSLALLGLCLVGLSGCGLIDFGSGGGTPSKYQDLSKTELKCVAISASKNQLIVRTASEYAALFQAPQTTPDMAECKALSHQPPVDLALYTILGALLTGTGCQAQLDQMVDRNDKTHSITYQVTFYTLGKCKKQIQYSSWIAVDRIPEDYQIIFDVRSQHVDT
ncbi:hypothetical protein HYR54_04120 [Candidatus Acetothermia bacterium]|nr:hypothetical protein [Candidatus Acetothermia bacterium]